MVTRSTVLRGLTRANYPGRDRLADKLALALGVTPATAKQLLYGPTAVNLRAAQMITVLREHGDRHAYGRFLVPMLRAVRAPRPGVRGELLALQAQTADLDEDAAEKAFDLFRTPATRVQLVRAIETEIGAQVERLAALRGEAV